MAAIPLPSIKGSKLTKSPPLVADADAPKKILRLKSRLRGRALVTLVKPKEASKQEVELGIGSFASVQI